MQQVCNITSFCGVSLFDLANRHLVASPELARARAAVLEYLRTPSSETDDDAVDFNIGAPPESPNPSPNPKPQTLNPAPQTLKPKLQLKTSFRENQTAARDEITIFSVRESERRAGLSRKKWKRIFRKHPLNCISLTTCAKRPASRSTCLRTTPLSWICTEGGRLQPIACLLLSVCLNVFLIPYVCSPDHFGPIPSAAMWFCR